MKIAYKTMTYGVTHMIVAFLAAWAVSGSLLIAVGISMVEPAFQITAYFIHEKLWTKFGHRAEAPQDKAGNCAAPCCTPLIATILTPGKDKDAS